MVQLLELLRLSHSLLGIKREERAVCLPVSPSPRGTPELFSGSWQHLDTWQPRRGPCCRGAGGALPRGSSQKARQHRSAFASRIAKGKKVLSQLISAVRSHWGTCSFIFHRLAIPLHSKSAFSGSWLLDHGRWCSFNVSLGKVCKGL